MLEEPGKLSRQTFNKLLSGTKGYVTGDVKKELKRVGLSASETTSVSRHQAMKAIRHLQKEGYLTKSKTPQKIYREAGLKQARSDEAARLENQKKMARVYIAMELEEDEKEFARQGGKGIEYDGRSSLSGYSSVAQDIEKDRFNRERKVQAERDKMQSHFKVKGVHGNKPNLVDIDKLPDMDIG